MTDKVTAAKEALELAIHRINYLASMLPDVRHEEANEKHFIPQLKSALETVAADDSVGDDLNAVCRGRIEMLISMGFTHRFEGASHVVEGHGFTKKHSGLLSIGDRINYHLKKHHASPPDGFVMVPVEPTRHMMFAGFDKIPYDDRELYDIGECYKAMIAAAQKEQNEKQNP